MAAAICAQVKPSTDMSYLGSENGKYVYLVSFREPAFRAVMDRDCSWWNQEMIGEPNERPPIVRNCKARDETLDAIRRARLALKQSNYRTSMLVLIREAERAARLPECDQIRAHILADKAVDFANNPDETSCRLIARSVGHLMARSWRRNNPNPGGTSAISATGAESAATTRVRQHQHKDPG